MAGYTKLFSSILHSTIWREPNHVRIVWITLLAMANKQGIADTSIPGLADAARIPLQDCEDALGRLKAPDPYSRSTDAEGRRIEAVDGGFRLINHSKYREKMNADERREYLRIKQAEYRRRKHGVNTSQQRHELSRMLTHTEPDPTPDPDPRERTRASDDFAVFWDAYPKKVGKDAARKAWTTKRPALATVLEALRAQRSYLLREDGRYIPNPATWINQGRWQDDPPVVVVTGGATSRTLGRSQRYVVPCPHAPVCADTAACCRKQDAERES